jgi:ribosomal protein S18 acetylase RimI-like enzyme
MSERAVWLGQHLFEIVPVNVIERATRSAVPEPAHAEGSEIEAVDSTRPGAWRALVPRNRWKALEANLARGDRGYLATVDGRFAGWIWVSRRSHRDPWSGLRIRLAPDEAYTYGMWVDPLYRAVGLAASLVAAMLEDLRGDPDVELVYGWVDARNRQSEMLLRIVFGFTHVQTVRRVHLLRRLGWQVPRSDEPRFGPLSRRGRHSEASSA